MIESETVMNRHTIKKTFSLSPEFIDSNKENSFFAQLIPMACDCDEKFKAISLDKKLFNG